MTQAYSFGRTLQRLGQQNAALEIFRNDIKKNPSRWIAHAEGARVAVGKGDYDGAAKEMRLAGDAAQPALKEVFIDLVRQLEHRVDINR